MVAPVYHSFAAFRKRTRGKKGNTSFRNDKNTLRLFGQEKNIGELNFSEIKESFPLIPTFEEVVNTFGKNIHLMIELKEEFNENKKSSFKNILNNIDPETDFHLLSLNPQILDQVDFISSKALLPVAEVNSTKLSRLALEKNWGGICGHYFLISNALIKKHHSRPQLIGTGHVKSINCLYREVNRGVDLIFTNDLKKLIP